MATTRCRPGRSAWTACLDAGYYSKSCPDMEAVVQKAIDKDYTLAPSLIRLFFHDFAVQVPCRAK
jgi:hypothetical protein